MTDLALDQSAERLRGDVDDVTRADIRCLANVRHKPVVIRQLITTLAPSVASDVTFTTLASDARPVAPAITVETVSTYVELLERLFLVEVQPAGTPKLRSRARLRASPRLHLVDPALIAAALGGSPDGGRRPGADRGRSGRDHPVWTTAVPEPDSVGDVVSGPCGSD
jgi:predicted AAA+ superfamily ATPase